MEDDAARPEPQSLRPPPPRFPPTAVATGGPDDAPLDGDELFQLALQWMAEDDGDDPGPAEAEIVAAILLMSVTLRINRLAPFLPMFNRHLERLKTQLAIEIAIQGPANRVGRLFWSNDNGNIPALKQQIERVEYLIKDAERWG